ncbi:MAG: hypothetical protein K8S87_05650, partial [Planctomycetes bacterium]|nr:hypothetical protein [Planctomycetota bacterium]
QQCLSENNGPLAKATISLMQNLVEKNPKYKFSTEFLKLKSDMNMMVIEYNQQEIKETGRYLRNKTIKNMTVEDATKHETEIKNYISKNSKFTSEYDLDEKLTKIQTYIKKRQSFESDEARITQIMEAYEGVDTKVLAKLFNFKGIINGLLNTRPAFEKDTRIIEIINNIERHIDNTTQKKELIDIYNDFKQVHQPGTKIDLTELMIKFNNFLNKNPLFKNTDEIAIRINKEASAKFKDEENMKEELEDAYTKWEQIIDTAERKNQVRTILSKFNNYISKVPGFEKDASIENKRDVLDRSLDDNKEEAAQILAFKNESESVDTIEKIDDLKKRIFDYLKKFIHLQLRLKETTKKLNALRAILVIKRDEEKLAGEYAVIVEEVINKLSKDKTVVAEGENLLEKLSELVKNTIKNPEKFYVLIQELEDALNHERLVKQARWKGFVWQAELVETNDTAELQKLYDANTIGHRDEITVITFDEDMKFLMSCDKSGIIKVYMLENFEEIRSFSVDAQINAAVFTSKPEIVVLAFGNGNLELWNIALRQKVKLIRKFDEPIQSLVYFNDSIFCTGDESRILQLSLNDDFKELNNYSEPRDKINSITISPDKKWLAAGCSDNKTYIWSLENKNNKKVLHGYHTASISQVSFSGDSQRILSNSDDGKAAIWSVMSGSLSRGFLTRLTIKSGRFMGMSKVILFSESRNSASGIEGEIEVIDINRPTEKTKIDTVYGTGKFIKLLKFSNNQYLYFAKKDGSINVYVQDENNNWQSVIKTDFIVDAEMFEDNEFIKIFRSGRIQRTGADGKIVFDELLKFGVINCASISVQEKKAVIGTNKGVLIYLNFDDTGKIKEIKEVNRFKSPITTVSIKKDASQVIVGLSNKSAYIYDSKGKQSIVLSKFNDPIDISATNASDTLAVYGIKSGHLTPISLPAGIKGTKRDISIICNEITFVEFNKKDKHSQKDDLLFIGHKNRRNKCELIKLDTEFWNAKKLITDLPASITSIVEISNTQMLVALENGDVLYYRHNLYNDNKDILMKFTFAGKLSIKNTSDFVYKFFYRD